MRDFPDYGAGNADVCSVPLQCTNLAWFEFISYTPTSTILLPPFITLQALGGAGSGNPYQIRASWVYHYIHLMLKLYENIL